VAAATGVLLAYAKNNGSLWLAIGIIALISVGIVMLTRWVDKRIQPNRGHVGSRSNRR
jgi:uncharacterized membrane protein